MHHIYKLYFAEEPNTIFIGHTNDVKRRLRQHLNLNCIEPKALKNNWSADRIARGWELKIEIIMSCDINIIKDSKTNIIQSYTEMGYILKNTPENERGCTKGHICSEETRKKMSEVRKGKVTSLETRKKLSEAKQGKTYRAKTYTVINPEGEFQVIINLSQFCRNNNLDVKRMSTVASGKTKHHKGWKCFLGEPQVL